MPGGELHQEVGRQHRLPLVSELGSHRPAELGELLLVAAHQQFHRHEVESGEVVHLDHVQIVRVRLETHREVIGLVAEQPTAVVNHDRCPGIGAHPCGAGSQVESQRMTEQDFLVPGLYGQCPVVCDEVQPAQVDGVALQLHLQTVHASSGRDRQHRALRPHALQRGAGAVGNRRTERH